MCLFTLGDGSFCLDNVSTNSTNLYRDETFYLVPSKLPGMTFTFWTIHLGRKKSNKDVAPQGVNPTPSVCTASVLALVTPTLYTAIFSTKLLQPLLPAA